VDLHILNSNAVSGQKSMMESKNWTELIYEYKDLQYLWRVEQAEPSTLVWEYIFHKIICVSHSHTYKVYPDGIA